jgi:hypothetical protein
VSHQAALCKLASTQDLPKKTQPSKESKPLRSASLKANPGAAGGEPPSLMTAFYEMTRAQSTGSLKKNDGLKFP